jgi:hypothetical protein
MGLHDLVELGSQHVIHVAPVPGRFKHGERVGGQLRHIAGHRLVRHTALIVDGPLTIHQHDVRPFVVQIHTQIILIHRSSLFSELISWLSVYQVEELWTFSWYQAADSA